MAETKKVKLTLTGSPIGRDQRQKDTLRGLGLTRRGKTVELQADAAVQGMIDRVAHLVRVES